MCGIAGIIHLSGEAAICPHTLARMSRSLLHRGPDEEGYFIQKSVGLAARRLAIVGLQDGQQPVYNEDRSVVAVFNGELFDYPELRKWLVNHGHTLRSHTDSELLVHLWEQYGEDMFPHLRVQFAFALLDLSRRRLILARDRVGICPLHWARTGDWLIFGSEIKALLASGMIPRAADPTGLDNIFTFFCMPGRRTAFKGIQAVSPGNFVRIDFGSTGECRGLEERTYWDFDFPNQGEEDPCSNPVSVTSTFEGLLRAAISKRLRADVPVASYLSGGVDSSLVLAMSHQIDGSRMSTFTARVGDSTLDETATALHTAADFGTDHHTVECNRSVLTKLFPQTIIAADCPVVDPNAGSLHALSKAVNRAGYKVILTGEGADEALAGYIWFKAHRLISRAWWNDRRPGVSIARKLYQGRYWKAPPGEFDRINETLGGLHAQTLVYHLTSIPKWGLLRDDYLREIGSESAYDQLRFDAARVRRWHPLNQSLYMTYKTNLAGLLLNHRGDRASMANSVEARYPFLDEDVIAFCAGIDPNWKLRGLLGDKYLLRVVAERYLPTRLAWRRKAMFRAPFAETFLRSSAAYVRQLISPESLKKTDYFRPSAVEKMLSEIDQSTSFRPFRLFREIGLCAVLGTQLWHHLFLGGVLCELPEWSVPESNVR